MTPAQPARASRTLTWTSGAMAFLAALVGVSAVWMGVQATSAGLRGEGLTVVVLGLLLGGVPAWFFVGVRAGRPSPPLGLLIAGLALMMVPLGTVLGALLAYVLVRDRVVVWKRR